MKKILLLAVVFAFLVSMVHADFGPKPDMSIAVTFEGKPIADENVYANMFVCESNNSFSNGAYGGYNYEQVVRNAVSQPGNTYYSRYSR